MDTPPRQPPLPEVLDRRITYLIRRIADAAGRKANAALAPLEIDGRRYAVLTVLATSGAPSQRIVAETLNIDRATVVALVDALEERGLVQRATNRQDRRANAIELTAEGRQILAQADALMEACERSFLEAVPERERGDLAAILQRLLAANA